MVRDDNGIDYCWYGERDLTLDTDNNIFATDRLEGNVGEKIIAHRKCLEAFTKGMEMLNELTTDIRGDMDIIN